MYDASVLDPTLLAHVDEMRAIEKAIQQLMPDRVDVGSPERLAQMRAMEGSSEASGLFAYRPFEGAEDRMIPGPGGEIRLHVLHPPEVRAVYLHLHGGGWTLGRPEMNDATNWPLAQRAKVAVASVNYRLAPEHPYPAGPDDCEAAARRTASRSSRSRWPAPRTPASSASLTGSSEADVPGGMRMYAGLIAALAGGLGLCIGIWLKGRSVDRRERNLEDGLEQRRQLYDRFGKLAYATLRGGNFSASELYMYAEALPLLASSQVVAAVDNLIEELSKLKGAKEDSDIRAAYGAWHSYLHAISEDLGFQSDDRAAKP